MEWLPPTPALAKDQTLTLSVHGTVLPLTEPPTWPGLCHFLRLEPGC